MSKEGEQDSGVFIGEHKACIAEGVSELGGRKSCDSSDGLAIYEHLDETTGKLTFDGHCFSCKGNFSVKELRDSVYGPELYDGAEGRAPTPRASKKEPITLSEFSRLHSTTGFVAFNWRGIYDEYNEFYGHLTRIVGSTPIARYYPETVDYSIKGYKCRVFPKDFSRGKLGLTGNGSQLSGQAKFKGKKGKYILIVGGEEDKVAAYQMLRESQKERNQGQYDAIPVVSPTSGEGSAAKQCAANRDFLDRYDNIILGFDNDEAGIAAMKATAAVLPKHKVKLVEWSNKDPNEMLLKGQEKQFIRDFYGAEEYIASGIKTSKQIDVELIKELLIAKTTLPECMQPLQEMMCGGFPLGYIINIIADTGIGKTEHVNSIFLHMIFNSIFKVGVVSLELTAGQYGIAMLSKFIGKNLLRFENGQDAVDYINTPEILAKREELWTNEFGEPRWSLLDERDGSIEGLQDQVEKLIHQHGCKFIVIDVLSDLLEGASIEEQGLHMKWQKGIVKNGVTIINVVHSRKPGTSSDGVLRRITEYDAYGSSTIVKSAGANLLMHRDKMNEDPIIRNTTELELAKCRWSGITGDAGKLYYDGMTRQTYNYDKYFGPAGHESAQPVKEAEVIDQETGEVHSVG